MVTIPYVYSPDMRVPFRSHKDKVVLRKSNTYRYDHMESVTIYSIQFNLLLYIFNCLKVNVKV